VAISSLAAYKGLPGSAGYSATKAAVKTYCEGLRLELRNRGVAVTCVCPGFVKSEMTAGKSHPMPLLLETEDAAKRIVRALRGRPAVYNFPWQMALLMKLVRWLPDSLVAKMIPSGQPTATGSTDSPKPD
jgi:short-subunit dehydrogenase